MAEKIYTIPINDALAADDECLFCFMNRKAEEHALDFTLGNQSSYMEDDIRAMTDEKGFCRDHYKKMFEYGNSLGNALIIQTHYRKLHQEMKQAFAGKVPEKKSFFTKMRSRCEESSNAVSAWIRKKEASCFICESIAQTMERSYATFLGQYSKDPTVKSRVQNGKGFCLHHLGELLAVAENTCSSGDFQALLKDLEVLMEKNFTRMEEDISWLVDKYDYRNARADWKNSKDALQRGMQKLKGGYPEDDFYKAK